MTNGQSLIALGLGVTLFGLVVGAFVLRLRRWQRHSVEDMRWEPLVPQLPQSSLRAPAQDTDDYERQVTAVFTLLLDSPKEVVTEALNRYHIILQHERWEIARDTGE